MHKIYKKVLSFFSSIEVNMTKNYPIYRSFYELTHVHILKKMYKRLNINLFLKKQIHTRLYIPNETTDKLIIYIHGGGWTLGNIDTYDKMCSLLSTVTNSYVVSIDYPLAPENPFPEALNVCYEVVKYFYSKESFLDTKEIIIMGDSAGGNICAALSLKARDLKEFKIKKQILLYPLTYHDHSINSKFLSITSNGEDYILTCKRIDEYLKLYVGDNDITNEYITPLNAKSFKKQPKTLIVSAKYDPLCDEGEEFGKRLIEDKNECKIVRINAIHGFFNSPFYSKNIEKTFKHIKKFVEK